MASKEQSPRLDQPLTPAARTFSPDEAVALEATSDSWSVYDYPAAHGGPLLLVNPNKTRLVVEARIKTDQLSPEVLAHTG